MSIGMQFDIPNIASVRDSNPKTNIPFFPAENSEFSSMLQEIIDRETSLGEMNGSVALFRTKNNSDAGFSDLPHYPEGIQSDSGILSEVRNKDYFTEVNKGINNHNYDNTAIEEKKGIETDIKEKGNEKTEKKTENTADLNIAGKNTDKKASAIDKENYSAEQYEKAGQILTPALTGIKNGDKAVFELNKAIAQIKAGNLKNPDEQIQRAFSFLDAAARQSIAKKINAAVRSGVDPAVLQFLSRIASHLNTHIKTSPLLKNTVVPQADQKNKPSIEINKTPEKNPVIPGKELNAQVSSGVLQEHKTAIKETGTQKKLFSAIKSEGSGDDLQANNSSGQKSRIHTDVTAAASRTSQGFQNSLKNHHGNKSVHAGQNDQSASSNAKITTDLNGKNDLGGIQFGLQKFSVEPAFEKNTISAPVRANAAELVHKVAEQIKFAAAQGKEFLSIKVNPENLGKIDIFLTKEDGTMTAKFFVENSAVKELLESRLQEMRVQLNNEGFAFSEFSVGVDSGAAGKKEFGQQASGASESGSGFNKTDKNQNTPDNAVTIDAYRKGTLDLVA